MENQREMHGNYLQFYLFQCRLQFFFACIHYNIIPRFFNVFIGIDEVSMRLLLLLQQRFIVIKLIMHICIGNHLNV